MTALTAQSAEPIPGYSLKERLGAGGYGEVWKAEAPGGLLKAIKFVFGYHDEDRAARELKALNRIKQVRHPFLLSLERIEVIEGQLVIVTELADESLKDVYSRRRSEGLPGIPRDELLQFMRDTADALDYMTSKFQLQHLDIKPENLLLIGGRITVGDFGLVKDIHDHTMSLMGGLTPVYAPPEVFDGNPSLQSDQYSLAIVYQQMLTGDLPFLGRTAAQLASQHMNDRPRLSSLPPDDRPIVERALSKHPHERWSNCREMVDRLAGRAPAGALPRAAGGDGSAEAALPATPSARLRKTVGRTEALGDGEPDRASVEQRMSREEALCSTPASFDGDTFVPRGAAAPRVVALPPLEDATFTLRARPTVFVAIGGAGIAALKGLRGRIDDRFGPLADLPAFQMLAIDTDHHALKEAEFGEGSAAFHASETLTIPLRRPQDYKNANHQAWLSRRWLYNIPRSLKTEGLRPLGRLAMADHVALIAQRLQKAIVAATSRDARSRTAERLGAPLDETPRVVIVASISGGTGGGAALDMAYLARQALADLGMPKHIVDGVLTHAVGRNPQTKDLALANGFAFLRELNHYQRRGYPGDRACELPPFDETPPFTSAYVVYQGRDLNDEGFAAASESIADYLYLDCLTAAGDVFQRCRSVLDPQAPGEPTVRSFGVSALGAASRNRIDTLTEGLCRGVLDRWRGQAEASRAARLGVGAVGARPEETPEAPLDPLAVERAGGLRIDLDEWLRRAQQIVEAILRAEPDSFFNSLVSELLPPEYDHEAPGDLTKPAAEILRAINTVLGHREADDEYHETTGENVADSLEQRIGLLAGRQAMAIQRCVSERLDAPKRMVRSAQLALKEYDEQLRGVDQKARAVRQEVEQELQMLQEQIRAFRSPDARRGAPRNNLQPTPQQLLRQLLQDYARRRLLSVCLQGACKLSQTVCRRLSLAGDELKDLARGLDRTAEQFTARFEEGAEDSVGDSLRSRVPELISLLDEQFRSAFFPAGEGFRAALRKEFQFAERLPDALRETARRLAAEAVRSLEISHTLFPEGEDQLQAHERLAGIVQGAHPRAMHCGGAARMLLVLPERSGEARVQALFAARFGQRPTTAFDSHCDAALCCEMEQIPIAPLAAMLIDNRRDCAEAASRLHTRSDINWTPWPRSSDAGSR